MNIADFLGYGAENAIPAATLAAMLQVSPRKLRSSMDLLSYGVGGQRETRFPIPPADGRALRHFRKVIAAKRPRT